MSPGSDRISSGLSLTRLPNTSTAWVNETKNKSLNNRVDAIFQSVYTSRRSLVCYFDNNGAVRGVIKLDKAKVRSVSISRQAEASKPLKN